MARTKAPAGPVGWPQDIAEMVAFLLDGKRAGFITGRISSWMTA
jgi:NAD(P)-dependent dehydrogenase (short-subunit alcohol dehydrogenase family)